MVQPYRSTDRSTALISSHFILSGRSDFLMEIKILIKKAEIEKNLEEYLLQAIWEMKQLIA